MSLGRWIRHKRYGLDGLLLGGNGESFEQAVIIDTTDMDDGIRALNHFIARRHGARGRDWTEQSLRIWQFGGRVFEVVTIALRNGEVKTLHFDLSRIHVPGGVESEENQSVRFAKDYPSDLLVGCGVVGLCVLLILGISRISPDLKTQMRILGGLVFLGVLGAVVLAYPRPPRTPREAAALEAKLQREREMAGVMLFIIGPVAAVWYRIFQGDFPVIGPISPVLLLLVAGVCGSAGFVMCDSSRSRERRLVAGSISGIGAFLALFIYLGAFHRESFMRVEILLVAAVGMLPGLLILLCAPKPRPSKPENPGSTTKT